MAKDTRKLKDKAQALMLKGKYAKALGMYMEIMEADPKDLKIWVKIGDLYRKLKRPEQAIDIYKKAARSFAMGGFLMQAISVNKMILEVDPEHVETQQELAELYAKKEGQAATSSGSGAKAVPAASLSILESMKKKGASDAVVMPDEEMPKSKRTAEAKPAPEPEAATPAPPAEAQDSEPLDIGFEPEPEEPEEAAIIADEPEDADIVLEDEELEGLTEDGNPQFDSLDLDLADNLFDNIMSQEDVVLDTGDGAQQSELPNIPLFSSLNSEEFTSVLGMLNLRRFDVKDRIIKEGESGESFYIIAKGSAEVVKRDPDGNEVHIANLAEGSFFGEFAFFNDSERNASVVVKQEMEALEIGRDQLAKLVEQYPRIGEVMKEFYQDRLLSSLLAISPLFQPFSDEEKLELLEAFERKSLDIGSIIIKQGEEGQGLYLILSGQVNVTVKTPEGDMHEVALLTEGSFFGEISLITDGLTTANCIAADDVELFVLPKAKFKELIMAAPRLLDVVSEFSERRSDATQRVVAKGETALAEAGMV